MIRKRYRVRKISGESLEQFKQSPLFDGEPGIYIIANLQGFFMCEQLSVGTAYLQEGLNINGIS